MSYAPCKNPNCNSYGQPHPNCKCYGEMAEGGEIVFCDGPHNPECQYFSDGGEAIDPSSVVVDSDIPNENVVLDKPAEQASIDPSKVVVDEDKYSSRPQLYLAEAEKIGRGALGPIVPATEQNLTWLGVPGLTAEDQEGREKALGNVNSALPIANEIAGAVGIGGVAKAVTKGLEGVAAGSRAIQGAIQNGLFQFGDEISKSLLHQTDPEDPVAYSLLHIGASTLLGAIGGKASHAIDTQLDKIPKTLAEINSDKYFEKAVDKIADWTMKAAAGYAGYKHGGIYEAATLAGLEDKVKGILSKLIGKPLGEATQKYIAPMILRVLGSGEREGLHQVIEHGENIAKGAKALNQSVESLFRPAGQKTVNFLTTEKNRDELSEYMTGGGYEQNIQQQIYDDNQNPEPQGFAHGGKVHKAPKTNGKGLIENKGLEKHYPDQNMLMNMARGRVSNYLMGLRPQENVPKLIFDKEPDNRSQKKSYHRALDLANHPLSIMDEIHKGTIEPEHVKHFNSMYPEVSEVMKKKITERITHAQLKGETPSAKVRQGLSLFMGTALSSEMTPAGIMAAQAVFANKQAPQPQQKPPSASATKSLTKSDSAFLTGSQSLQRRQQKA